MWVLRAKGGEMARGKREKGFKRDGDKGGGGRVLSNGGLHISGFICLLNFFSSVLYARNCLLFSSLTLGQGLWM